MSMKRLSIILIYLLGFFTIAAAQKKASKAAKNAVLSQKIFITNKLFKELSASDYKKFKDSIFANTKDTLTRIGKRSVQFSPANTITTTTQIQDNWAPSIYVYTNAKGNLTIQLPNTNTKRYSLFIYDGKLLLHNITNLQEDYWIIEKSNFYHSGWYNFELYCNGELLERNKFLLH
ncbi:MAG: hypothetical protein ACK41Z_01340 [Sediminibacterium sp.]